MTGTIMFCGMVISFTLAFLAILTVTDRISDKRLDASDVGICALQAALVGLFWPITVPLGVVTLLCWGIFVKFIAKDRNKSNV